MPRPRVYYDDATRAAAWRLRREKEHLKNANLALEARRLQRALEAAVAAGDEMAVRLVGASVEETIRKLTAHFEEKGRQAT